MKKIRTSIEIYAYQSEQLQQIAASLGYLQIRGVGANKMGSISKLVRAIASEEVTIKLASND